MNKNNIHRFSVLAATVLIFFGVMNYLQFEWKYFGILCGVVVASAGSFFLLAIALPEPSDHGNEGIGWFYLFGGIFALGSVFMGFASILSPPKEPDVSYEASKIIYSLKCEKDWHLNTGDTYLTNNKAMTTVYEDGTVKGWNKDNYYPKAPFSAEDKEAIKEQAKKTRLSLSTANFK